MCLTTYQPGMSHGDPIVCPEPVVTVCITQLGLWLMVTTAPSKPAGMP